MVPLLTATLYFWLLSAQENDDEVIYGPSSPTDWSTWINSIKHQRTKDLESINYNGSIFSVPELQWTQSSFIQPQMHGFDKWLNDLKSRYGGIDSLLFWVTYSNLGADDRNQFDMKLAIPGGMEALKNITNYFHSQDPPIQVLVSYNPWDIGTRDSGNPDYITMAEFLAESGADGFNGDTMYNISEDFYTYSVNKYDHPIALEPEWGGTLDTLNWDTLGWGYWPCSNYKPNVDKWKWYDGRYMTHICERWSTNHTDNLQNAFFNGVGFESWENVFGVWNGIQSLYS